MYRRNVMVLFMLFLLISSEAVLWRQVVEGSSNCWQQEKEALLDLQKAATEDVASVSFYVAYNKSDVWFEWDDEVADCCEWQGVHCDQHSGRVIELRLPTCEGPSKIEPHNPLPVHCYSMCSSLPPSLSRLEALEVLDLSGGCLVGDIPPRIFTSLTNLTHLDLSNNFFYPLHLPLLPKLTYFNFSRMMPFDQPGLNLSNLARSMPNLRYLDLSNGFLSNIGDFGLIEGPIPSEFSASFLSHLVYLDLSGQGLQGVIPEQLGTLQSLTYLNLAGNRFQNPLPWPSLANLSQLTHLELGNLDADESLIAADDAEVLVWEERRAQWQCNWNALESLSCHNMRFSSNVSIPFCLEQPRVMSKLKTLSFSDHTGSIGPLLHSLALVNASLNVKALLLPGTSLGEFQAAEYPPAWLHPLETPFLESLDLSNNALTSLPAWLPQFPLLENLDISNNHFLEFPSSLQQLQFLKTLDMSRNGLNVSLYQLELHSSAHLHSLTLSQNAITGAIPLSLLQPSLSVLELSNNLLEGGIPSSLGNLSWLSHLDLSNNNLKGEIPSSIGSMPKLSYLDLSHNMLSGVLPVSMANLSALTELKLSRNDLEGIIPLFIFDFKLSELDLSYNKLVGSLPQSLQNCGALERLDLSNNNLSGSLPHLFQNCPILSTINLSNNRLSGALPQTYNCKLLAILDLSSNNLHGGLPGGLFVNCSGLGVINLGQNSLSLEIPASVANLKVIRVLILYNNELSGEIPSALQNCSSMEVLDLSYNQFSGRIPKWITGANFPNLLVLMLSNNQFQGDIPLSLVGKKLASLQILGLANNHLSGSIPTHLDDLVGMTYAAGDGPATSSSVLYMVTLNIPFKGTNRNLGDYILSVTMALDLSNNHLEGPIPPQIGALKGLRILNLSHNALSGPIPSTLGGLSGALESLDLSSNQLTGGIPSELCEFDRLGDLNLSTNHLQGTIPSCPRLSTFDAAFAHNDGLCGSITPNQCAAPAQAEQEAHLTWFAKVQEVVSLAGLGIGYAVGLLLTSLLLYFRS